MRVGSADRLSPAAGVIRARTRMSARSLTTLRPQPSVRCTQKTISPSLIPVSSASRRSPSFVSASITFTGTTSPSMESSANFRIRSMRFASVRLWRSSLLSRFFRLWMIASCFTTSVSLASSACPGRLVHAAEPPWRPVDLVVLCLDFLLEFGHIACAGVLPSRPAPAPARHAGPPTVPRGCLCRRNR